MKSKLDEISQRYLLLFKLDAIRLFERLRDRRAEYIEVFAMKRTREHFHRVFYSRYREVKIEELSHASADIIIALDQFYSLVDDLQWYLEHTEDMPITVEETLGRELKKLGSYLEKVNLYIDAELGVIQEANDIGELPSTPFE